jgi:ribose 5-phosphate isomerase B
VEHDDANVLALGSGIVGIEVIREVVRAFLDARFDGGERYQRRLDKVAELENNG